MQNYRLTKGMQKLLNKLVKQKFFEHTVFASHSWVVKVNIKIHFNYAKLARA